MSNIKTIYDMREADFKQSVLLKYLTVKNIKRLFRSPEVQNVGLNDMGYKTYDINKSLLKLESLPLFHLDALIEQQIQLENQEYDAVCLVKTYDEESKTWDEGIEYTGTLQGEKFYFIKDGVEVKKHLSLDKEMAGVKVISKTKKG
jgi:hypothetical protein